MRAEHVREHAVFDYDLSRCGEGILYFGSEMSIVHSRSAAKFLAWYDLDEHVSIVFMDTAGNTASTLRIRVFDILNRGDTLLSAHMNDIGKVKNSKKVLLTTINYITSGYRKIFVFEDGTTRGGERKSVCVQVDERNLLAVMATAFQKGVLEPARLAPTPYSSRKRHGMRVSTTRHGNILLSLSDLNDKLSIVNEDESVSTFSVVDIVLDTEYGAISDDWYLNMREDILFGISEGIREFRYDMEPFTDTDEIESEEDEELAEEIAEIEAAANAAPYSRELNRAQRWKHVRDEHKTAMGVFSSYESDPWLAITYPAFNDVNVDEVSAMIKSMKTAERFFTRREIERLDDDISRNRARHLPDESVYRDYAASVDDFVVSVERAKKTAEKLADSIFTEAEKKLLNRARWLLTHAEDVANTDDMKENYYQQLKKTIDKLNESHTIVPTRVVAEIESAARLLITDGSDSSAVNAIVL